MTTQAPTVETKGSATKALILPPWLELAYGQIGIHEGVGPKDNPTVLQYFVDAAHPEIKHDETAWCAAFANAMLHRAGIKGTGSLAARSFESWGQALKEPVLGCLCVKHRPGGWLGHVFFCVGASKTQIFGLGGNQDDQVSIEAFPRTGPKGVQAYRWPANLTVPTDLPLPTTIAGAKTNTKMA